MDTLCEHVTYISGFNLCVSNEGISHKTITEDRHNEGASDAFPAQVNESVIFQMLFISRSVMFNRFLRCDLKQIAE